MKNRLHLAIGTLIITLLSNSAWALSKAITLDFDDTHIKGQNVLLLKEAIKAQYPGLDIHQYDLEKVVLIGKTKRGHGRAHLRVAGWTSSGKRVAGNPRHFRDDRAWTHKETIFKNRGSNNHRYQDHGPWQLLLKGNFKVNKIVMVLNDHQTVSQRWWKPAQAWSYRDKSYRRHNNS